VLRRRRDIEPRQNDNSEDDDREERFLEHVRPPYFGSTVFLSPRQLEVKTIHRGLSRRDAKWG
jgi:hypothetical protein